MLLAVPFLLLGLCLSLQLGSEGFSWVRLRGKLGFRSLPSDVRFAESAEAFQGGKAISNDSAL